MGAGGQAQTGRQSDGAGSQAQTSRQNEGTGGQAQTHCVSGSQTSANLQLQATLGKFMYKVNVHHACSICMNCMMCARVYVHDVHT